jgi:hypothetical protein
VSYGAYLWHWPIHLVVTAERCHLHGVLLHALRAGVTFGIAALSYRFLEQPIRRHGLPLGRPRLVVPAAFAAACLSVVVGAWPRPSPLPASAPEPVVTTTSALMPVPVRLRVRVLGDSTANALGWMIKTVAAPDIDVELHAKDGLNLIDADRVRWTGHDESVDVTVVGAGGAFLYGIHVRGKWTVACHPRWDSLFEEGLDHHLRDLASSRSRLWLATAPYPLGPYDDHARRKQIDCINASIRKIARKHPRFRLLELGEMVCPKGECTREVDGIPLRRDGVHFDVVAASGLARRVLSALDPEGEPTARERTVSVALRP